MNQKKRNQFWVKFFRECQTHWPFELEAIVLLPDHLHSIWSLPDGDSEFSKRWSWVKKEFTKRWLAAGSEELPISATRVKKRRRGIWQARFWEHSIDDEDDFQKHFDYIHYNPVKHGYVKCPSQWKSSSFHRWVQAGVYPEDWACQNESPEPIDFDEISKSVGE